MDPKTEAILKQLSDINIFALKTSDIKLKNALAELNKSILSLKNTIASTKHLT